MWYQNDLLMVEVFKTNVTNGRQSHLLIRELLKKLPGSRINFDLDDIDNVLRVEGPVVWPSAVIAVLAANGYQCELL